jgi:protein required for attachment to host cells
MRRLPSGSLHLDVRANLKEEWDEKQHHRPYMLAGSGRSYASTGHEDEERLRRFGKQVAHWLGKQLADAHIEHVTVFTSARMLGALRPALPEALRRRVEIRDDDLALLRTAELAAHPAIVALMS